MIAKITATIAAIFFGSAPNCDESSKFQPTLVRFLPDPIVAGEHMQVNVAFLNNFQVINAGVQRMKVTFNGQPIPVPDESLCDYNADLCPIGLGQNAMNHTFTTPNIPGRVDMKIGWFTEDGATSLMCIHEVFDIEAPSKPKALRSSY